MARLLWIGEKARRESSSSLAGLFQDAAAVVARGKDGTVVFPAEQLTIRYGRNAVVRVNDAVIDAHRIPPPKILTDVVVKDVRDESAARAEALIHAFLRKCFSATEGLVGLSCFHPAVRTMQVSSHTLIPMRSCAPLPEAMTARDLLEMALAVLEALEVFHRNGVLHLDVKPHNIMMTKRASRGKEGGGGGGGGGSGGAYVLVDYDLVAHVDDVIDAMRDGPVPVGTVGYISPVLLSRVDPLFARCCQYVSSTSSAAAASPPPRRRSPPRDLDGWDAYFEDLRRRILLAANDEGQAAASSTPRAVTSIDLHSLAVTLYRLRGSPEAALSDGAEAEAEAAAIDGLIAGMLTGRIADATRGAKVAAKALGRRYKRD